MRRLAIDMSMARAGREDVRRGHSVGNKIAILASFGSPLSTVRLRSCGSGRHILRYGERDGKMDDATYCLLGFDEGGSCVQRCWWGLVSAVACCPLATGGCELVGSRWREPMHCWLGKCVSA